MLQTKHIAKSIAKLINEDSDPKQIVKRIKEYLDSKGASKLLSKLPKELEKLTQVHKKPTLIVAKTEDVEKAKKDLKLRDGEFNIKIDNTLIGGYIYKSKNKIIFNDYKHHLLNLYNKITSSI